MRDSGARTVLTPEGPRPVPGGTEVPAGAAYVIAGSGSTGLPEGALVGHGAPAARVAWMREA